jgi:hypothetical protein
MSQRLDGVRAAKRGLGLLSRHSTLQKSRMRRRARTDLCGGRSVRIVPTATAMVDLVGKQKRTACEAVRRRVTVPVCVPISISAN